MRLLAVILLVPAIAAAQPPATVTIYTPPAHQVGMNANLGLDQSNAAFMGAVFDGQDSIGYFGGSRFVTLALPPGPHTFEISDRHKGLKVRSETTIDLEAGKAYFLRASMSHKGYIIGTFGYTLKQVSCTDARTEADGNKPLEAKHIEKTFRSRLVEQVYFPQCAAPTTTTR